MNTSAKNKTKKCCTLLGDHLGSKEMPNSIVSSFCALHERHHESRQDPTCRTVPRAVSRRGTHGGPLLTRMTVVGGGVVVAVARVLAGVLLLAGSMAGVTGHGSVGRLVRVVMSGGQGTTVVPDAGRAGGMGVGVHHVMHGHNVTRGTRTGTRRPATGYQLFQAQLLVQLRVHLYFGPTHRPSGEGSLAEIMRHL